MYIPVYTCFVKTTIKSVSVHEQSPAGETFDFILFYYEIYFFYYYYYYYFIYVPVAKKPETESTATVVTPATTNTAGKKASW